MRRFFWYFLVYVTLISVCAPSSFSEEQRAPRLSELSGENLSWVNLPDELTQRVMPVVAIQLKVGSTKEGSDYLRITPARRGKVTLRLVPWASGENGYRVEAREVWYWPDMHLVNLSRDVVVSASNCSLEGETFDILLNHETTRLGEVKVISLPNGLVPIESESVRIVGVGGQDPPMFRWDSKSGQAQSDSKEKPPVARAGEKQEVSSVITGEEIVPGNGKQDVSHTNGKQDVSHTNGKQDVSHTNGKQEVSSTSGKLEASQENEKQEVSRKKPKREASSAGEKSIAAPGDEKVVSRQEPQTEEGKPGGKAANTSSATPTDPNEIFIHILDEKKIRFEGTPCAVDDLGKKIKEALRKKPDGCFVIHQSSGANSSIVRKVQQALTEAKAAHVRTVVEHTATDQKTLHSEPIKTINEDTDTTIPTSPGARLLWCYGPGKFFLNGKSFDEPSLRQALRSLVKDSPEIPIVVAGPKEAPATTLKDLASEVKGYGFQDVQLGFSSNRK